MTLLMISPYPPYRDGIAVYTAQEVRARRQAGESIEVLSPLPSAAHHHLVLGGPKGWGRLLGRIGSYESLVIQVYPELLHGACRNPVERIAAWTALEAVCRRKPTELRIHEIDYGPAQRNPLERRAAARAFRAADTIAMHTDAERDALCDAFGLSPEDVTLVDHGRYFRSRSHRLSQSEARAELGLDPHKHLFLTIGFIQEHKGFDRAVSAFSQLATSEADLHVVGSVRLDIPEFVGYARRLERQIASTKGAHFHQRFVSDDEFDLWVLASDTVVLPYREIYSSGVLERANLLDRPVIISRVGGLEDQMAAGSVAFDNDSDLVAAMQERLGEPAVPTPSTVVPTPSTVVPAIDPTTESLEAYVQGLVSGATEGDIGRVRVEPLLLADPSSPRPGVGFLKRSIQKLTAWQLVPVIERINNLEQHYAKERRSAGSVDGDA